MDDICACKAVIDGNVKPPSLGALGPIGSRHTLGQTYRVDDLRRYGRAGGLAAVMLAVSV